MKYLISVLLFTLSLSLSTPLLAQKVEKEKEIRLHAVVNSEDDRILGDLNDIDPDSIASINVSKENGLNKIEILLKNGDRIERVLSKKGKNLKTVILNAEDMDTDGAVMYTYKTDREEISEAFADIEPKDIETIDVKVVDGVRTLTVKTKDGTSRTKTLPDNTSHKVKSVFISDTEDTRSQDSERLDRLEEQLKRIEEKLDKLLKKEN